MRRFILFFVLVFILASCKTNDTKTGSDDYFVIPLAEINDQMTKYSYDSDSIKVNFFAVKGSDGEIRTAFDACDVCGGYMGYRQQGNDVICNKCGRNFKIDSIGTKNMGGGCWPSYLSHKIDGNDLLISKSELSKGAYRFA